MKKKFLNLLVICFISIPNLSSQNTINLLIENKLKEYVVEEYPEKIYIHTDKSFYSTGENIWFSLYLVNGINHQKPDKSKVIYVELINDKDSIVSQKKLYASDIQMSGDFTVSDKFLTGNYLLRGYTNYMRNMDHNYFFQKEITIISSKKENLKSNILEKISTSKKSTTYKPKLKFYPEGGYLINGLNNKVAVKLNDGLFDEKEQFIIIKDDSNEVISSFKTTNFGLGIFYMNPEKGKTYYAEIESLGNTFKYELPKSLENGYLVSTVINDENLLIRIKTNHNNDLLNTTLVMHIRGNLVFNQTFTSAEKSKNLKLPINNFPSGVLQITLFNPENKPCNERLVFINNKLSDAKININKTKDYYGTRKKVELNLSVKDTSNLNIVSFLSLSVKDLNAFPESTKSENIKTWLLLNSDLRGKIENPGYFFENKNDKKRKYLLDLVMMTHGWRRFMWQDLLSQTNNKQKFEAEKGLILSGKTLDMKSPYGIKSVPTRFTILGDPIIQEPIKTSNSKGEFTYGPYIFYDSIPIILEARTTNFNSKKDKDRNILIVQDKNINSPKIIRDSSNYNQNQYLEDFFNYEKYLKQLDSAFKQQKYVLNEVIVKTTKKDLYKLREQEMNSRTSYGSSFRRFDAENDRNANSLLDLFYSVPGVQVTGDSLIMRSQGRNIIPLILYDEIPIEMSDLRSISASEIYFIDILSDTESLIFSSSSNRVISVYSKTGDGNIRKNVKRKPGIINFSAEGFYTAKEFYAPDHINGIEEQTKADLRTTLHWVPKIKTTKTGEINITFFTSDLKSNYLIEIQGLTENGVPVYGTSKIIVE